MVATDIVICVMIYNEGIDYTDWVEDLRNEVKLINKFIEQQQEIINSCNSTEGQMKEAQYKIEMYRLYKKHNLHLIEAMEKGKV